VGWLLDLLELEDCTAVKNSWKEMVESQHKSIKEVAGSSAKHVMTVALERGTLSSLANVSKEQYIFLFPCGSHVRQNAKLWVAQSFRRHECNDVS
jgi:hypothetical protein